MGYDVADYCDIHAPYGTLKDIEALIAGLHERGMKLVMDLVVNHTSDQVSRHYIDVIHRRRLTQISTRGFKSQDHRSTAVKETGTYGGSRPLMNKGIDILLITGVQSLAVNSAHILVN